MNDIRFGTDGWRAIIAKDFTVDNLTRVAEATATWLKKKFSSPSVVIGYDCRFGGVLFSETIVKVMAVNRIKVFLSDSFVSTPMISLGTVRHNASIGIIVTASHNPATYNGYKLKGNYGGPMLPENVQEIEDLILESPKTDTSAYAISDFIKEGMVQMTNLEEMYCKHVEANFDLNLIRNCGLNFAYDAMFGSGQNVIKKLFPSITQLHCDHNPGFHGQAPEPIEKNLVEFKETIKNSGKIDCGLVTDGDADRIGLFDKAGNFIDSHHLILLLIKYLVEQKKMSGKVVTAFSVTPRVKKMCEHFGLKYQVVKIGFKYVAEVMLKEDVLLGGEESGVIAIKGHIPERDGIWIGLTIWEYMAKSGKSLNELIREVYEITGTFSFERSDLHLKEALKNKIVENCRNNNYKTFGPYKIQNVETIDGYKYFFSENEWLMIRASGTEPVLRNYAEAETKEKAFDILKSAEKTLLS